MDNYSDGAAGASQTNGGTAYGGGVSVADDGGVTIPGTPTAQGARSQTPPSPADGPRSGPSGTDPAKPAKPGPGAEIRQALSAYMAAQGVRLTPEQRASLEAAYFDPDHPRHPLVAGRVQADFAVREEYKREQQGLDPEWAGVKIPGLNRMDNLEARAVARTAGFSPSQANQLVGAFRACAESFPYNPKETADSAEAELRSGYGAKFDGMKQAVHKFLASNKPLAQWLSTSLYANSPAAFVALYSYANKQNDGKEAIRDLEKQRDAIPRWDRAGYNAAHAKVTQAYAQQYPGSGAKDDEGGVTIGN